MNLLRRMLHIVATLCLVTMVITVATGVAVWLAGGLAFCIDRPSWHSYAIFVAGSVFLCFVVGRGIGEAVLMILWRCGEPYKANESMSGAR
jgi:hypothetical protein